MSSNNSSNSTLIVNPYVGPRAFQQGEQLYGRDRETSRLLNLLIAERIVLLHSPSGAGKTSLIQAALVPRLQAKRFRVLPLARVNLEPPKMSQVTTSLNRYVFSVLSSLEDGLPQDQQKPDAELARLSLAEYLQVSNFKPQISDHTSPPSDLRPPISNLLIFDQFEEILTLDPTDQAAKKEFFVQLGEALGERNVWALFSIREDYVAALDPYLTPIPTRLSNTFRLDLLGVEAARQAIQEPACQAGVEFTADAAARLLDDLRLVQIQSPDGTLGKQPGPYVEPVQLQVVCYRLWQNRSPEDKTIDEDDIVAVGDADTALANYYADCVAAIAQQTGIAERAIREWFDHKLITEQNIRGQVLMGAQQSDGLDNHAIRELENAHLVRGEKRRGVTWYELAHDRLVVPVRQCNADWFKANLNLLQQQAALWEAQKRPEGLLLRGKTLGEAEQWARNHDLIPSEHDFLQACRGARAAARNRLALAAAFAILLVLIVVSVGFSAWRINQQSQENSALARINADIANTAQAASTQAVAQQSTAQAASTQAVAQQAAAQAASTRAVEQRNEAQKQSRLAMANQLAAQAQTMFEEYPQRSLLLAIEAMSATLRAGEPPVVNAEQSLRDALANMGGASLIHGQDKTAAIALSPDRRWLAACSPDGTIRTWDLATPDPAATLRVFPKLAQAALTSIPQELEELPPLPYEGYAKAFAISSSRRLAMGDRNGTVWLWDMAADDPASTVHTWCKYEEEIIAVRVAFSQDGRWLVTTGYTVTKRVVSSEKITDYSGKVTHLWDLDAPDPGAAAQVLHDQAKDFISPDGRWLATAEGKAIRLWNLAASNPTAHPQRLYGQSGSFYLSAVCASPDGRWLAATNESEILLWDLKTPNASARVLSGHNGGITVIALSGYSFGMLAAGDQWNHSVYVWGLGDRNADDKPVILHGPQDDITALSFSPEGMWLAAGSADKTAWLWQVSNLNDVASWVLRGPESAISTVAFSADRHWLVIGGQELWLWDLTSLDTSATPHILRSRRTWGYHSASAAISQGGRWLTFFAAGDIFKMRSDASWGHELDRTAWLWDLESPDPAATARVLRDHGEDIAAVTVSRDGRWMAIGNGNRGEATVRLWDLAMSDPIKPVQILRGHEREVTAMAISPDNHWLITQSEGEKNVRVWDLAAPWPITVSHIISHGGSYLAAFAVSPDWRWLITGGNDIRLWDLGAMRVTKTLVGPKGGLISIAAGPAPPEGGPLAGRSGPELAGARWLAASSQDNTVWVWDLTADDPSATVRLLRGHEDIVTTLAFSPDGRWLATGSYDKTVRVWDLAAPSPTGTMLGGHTDKITDIAFSPAPGGGASGYWLASGSADNTVRLWDLSATDPAASARVLRGQATSPFGMDIAKVSVSPNGRWLFTDSVYFTSRLWHLRVEELMSLACRTAGRNLTQEEWKRHMGDAPYHKTCENLPGGE